MKLAIQVTLTPKALEVDPIRETTEPTNREIAAMLERLASAMVYSTIYRSSVPTEQTLLNFEQTVQATVKMIPAPVFIQCDFNDGTRCTSKADNVGIDETTGKCVAIICEHHANCLADDSHQTLQWFVRE